MRKTVTKQNVQQTRVTPQSNLYDPHYGRTGVPTFSEKKSFPSPTEPLSLYWVDDPRTRLSIKLGKFRFWYFFFSFFVRDAFVDFVWLGTRLHRIPKVRLKNDTHRG